MKELTSESKQALLRRAAIIQAHTNAPTRDTASFAAFIATGGNQEYASRFALAASSLEMKGASLESLAQRVKTGGLQRPEPSLERENRKEGPDLSR